MSQYFDSVPQSWTTPDYAVTCVKYAFLAGVGVYLLSLPFCRSRKSFFDLLAARRVAALLRFGVVLEVLCLGILMYDVIQTGSPVGKLGAGLSFDHGKSWLYSFGRPLTGILLVGCGLAGHMHPVMRGVCIVGCLGEVMADALSAYQVHDYYVQTRTKDAPTHGYSPAGFQVYFWRDVVSVGLCTATGLLALHLSLLLGWMNPQYISYARISGGDLDRGRVMREQRERRVNILRDMGYGAHVDQYRPPESPRGYFSGVPVEPLEKHQQMTASGKKAAAAAPDSSGAEDGDLDEQMGLLSPNDAADGGGEGDLAMLALSGGKAAPDEASTRSRRSDGGAKGASPRPTGSGAVPPPPLAPRRGDDDLDLLV